MKERLDYIDTAKGILIMTVVMGHIFQAGYIHDFIYTFHMPAFFIISGMMLNYSHAYERPFLITLKKMVYTMVIPFFFFETCGCLLYIIRFGANQNIFGFAYNTIHLNFNNGINWYLFNLFIAELLFIIILKISNNKSFLVLTCIICTILGFVLPTYNSFLFISARTFICVSFLIIGYTFVNIFCKRNLPVMIGASAITIVVSIINETVDLSGMQFSNPYLYLLGSIAGTYALIQLCMYISIPIINYIGRNTLVIYGTHNIPYVLIGKQLGIIDFKSTPIFTGIILFFIVMAVEMPTIYIMTRFLPFLVGKKSSNK